MFEQYIDQMLYSLKKQYGAPCTLKKISHAKFNPETGETDRVTTTTAVKKALILEEDMYVEFGQNLGINYGGKFTVNKRIIIVDSKNLVDVKYGKGDFIVVGDDEFAIEDRSKIQNGKAHFFVCQMIEQEGDQ